MPKLRWAYFLKAVPKLVMFSFGIAICILVIFTLVAMVIMDGGFDTDTDSSIFGLVFVLSMIYFVIRKLRGIKNKNQCGQMTYTQGFKQASFYLSFPLKST